LGGEGAGGKDIALLYKIQSFFGVGKISIRTRNSSAVYAVKSLNDLINVIIPNFIKYPLLTQKRVDFELFKLVCELMSNKEHSTMAGLIKIVSIKASPPSPPPPPGGGGGGGGRGFIKN
jgi:hypothetical protein